MRFLGVVFVFLFLNWGLFSWAFYAAEAARENSLAAAAAEFRRDNADENRSPTIVEAQAMQAKAEQQFNAEIARKGLIASWLIALLLVVWVLREPRFDGLVLLCLCLPLAYFLGYYRVFHFASLVVMSLPAIVLLWRKNHLSAQRR